jgi:DNA-binding MarR family transcriptional regulator
VTRTISSRQAAAEHRREPRSRGGPRERQAITDELLDELTAWTPHERLRMLGACHHSGLSLGHLNVVTLLEMHGAMPMGRVAELLGVSMASATGIVDRMVERRLVERHSSRTDRRVVEVHLGDGGRELIGSLKSRRREHLSEVLGRMDERQLTALLEGLRGMHAAHASLEAERAPAEQPDAEGLLVVRVPGSGA